VYILGDVVNGNNEGKKESSMGNYPKDYTKKYWREIRREAYTKERKKIDARGEIMRRVISIFLGCLGVGLLVTFGLLKLQKNESVATVVFAIFIGDIIGFFGMLISTRVLAQFNEPEIVAQRDFTKSEQIKELEPIETNIEIIIPDDIFSNGDTIKLTIKNGNKTADIEKCFARFEYIGLFSLLDNQIYWFKFNPENYQKNILWDRKSYGDGTITISAGGKDVLNISKVVNDGFNFLFQGNEEYKQVISENNKQNSHDFLVQLKLSGHLSGHPIIDFREFYLMHLEFHPTIKQLQGKELLNQEIASALSNQTIEPLLQIRKAGINAETEIKEDKGIRIGSKNT